MLHILFRIIAERKQVGDILSSAPQYAPYQASVAVFFLALKMPGMDNDRLTNILTTLNRLFSSPKHSATLILRSSLVEKYLNVRLN